ncbi:hypothetical protein D3C78_1639100 [compost metagenome]
MLGILLGIEHVDGVGHHRHAHRGIRGRVSDRHTIEIEEFRPVVEVPLRTTGRVVLPSRVHLGVDGGGGCRGIGNRTDRIVVFT